MISTAASIFTLPTDAVIQHLVRNPGDLICDDSKRYKLWLHVHLDMAGRFVNGHDKAPMDAKAERVFSKSPILVYHSLLQDPILLNSWRFGVFAKTVVPNTRIATLAVHSLLRIRCGLTPLPRAEHRCNWCLNPRDPELNPEFFCCGTCEKVFYCDSKCQQKHGTFHQHECGNVTDDWPVDSKAVECKEVFDSAFDIDDELTESSGDSVCVIVFGDD